MITHRLNTILKKSSNRKYRNSYIKYLSSLDFKEFEFLFNHYYAIVAVLRIRYAKKTIKKYSKDWFKVLLLSNKQNKLHNLFCSANLKYVVKIGNDLVRDSEHTKKILQEIEDIKKLIKNTYGNEFEIGDPPTKQDIIRLLSLLINSVYIEQELERLHTELNKQ